MSGTQGIFNDNIINDHLDNNAKNTHETNCFRKLDSNKELIQKTFRINEKITTLKLYK